MKIKLRQFARRPSRYLASCSFNREIYELEERGGIVRCILIDVSTYGEKVLSKSKESVSKKFYQEWKNLYEFIIEGKLSGDHGNNQSVKEENNTGIIENPCNVCKGREAGYSFWEEGEEIIICKECIVKKGKRWEKSVNLTKL